MAVIDRQQESDADQRRRWHLQFYRELGLDYTLADLLDVAGVDPHAVAQLLLHGCPESLLIEILT
jgi:hypothetical protein